MSSLLSLPSAPLLSPLRIPSGIPGFHELSRSDPPSPPRAPPPSPQNRVMSGISQFSRSDPPSPPRAPPPSPQRRAEFSPSFFDLNSGLYELSRGGMQNFNDIFGGELQQSYLPKPPVKRARSNSNSDEDAYEPKKIRTNTPNDDFEWPFISKSFRPL